jgi:hypothetical protein
MQINDLKIPAALSEAIRSGHLLRTVGSWYLVDEFDAYGYHLETELGEVYSTPARIKEETDVLPEHFQPDGYYGESLPDLQGPGAIPDIIEFSKIICFAISGDGSSFCLDYRDTPDQPSVIWWDDVYWRRLAPDFDSFLSLFNIVDV